MILAEIAPKINCDQAYDFTIGLLLKLHNIASWLLIVYVAHWHTNSILIVSLLEKA